MRPFCLSILLFILINIASIHQTPDTDYCCLKCGKNHVMCQFPDEGRGKLCKGRSPHNPKLGPEDANYTVHFLNTVKNKAALGKYDQLRAYGASFRRLEWDDELEHMAIRWAQQCVAAGKTDKCRDTMRFDVDQILVPGKPKDKLKDLLKGAFKHQKCMYDFNNSSGDITNYCSPDLFYPGVHVKNFARLIRYENYKVGCAFQRLPNQSQIICNIGPGILQPNEQLGRWSTYRENLCIDCPNNTRCMPPYTALCAFEGAANGSKLTTFISGNVINYLFYILMLFFRF